MRAGRKCTRWRFTRLTVAALVYGSAACAHGDSRAADTSGIRAAEMPEAERPGAVVPPDPHRASEDSTAADRAVTDARPWISVVFMGTSLTAGYGIGDHLAFPQLLQHKSDSAGFRVRVVNAGVSGETSAGALRRIDWVLRGPTDVFVLETGANDALRASDINATRRNIEAVIDRVKAAKPGARILLVQMEAPPNLGARYTSQFRAMYAEIVRARGITLVPFLLKGVAGRAELNQPDGIHPNVSGERIVAENVWPTLEAVLRELDPTAKAR